LDIEADNEQLLKLCDYCDWANDALNLIHGIDVNGNEDLQSYPILSGRITQVDDGVNDPVML
jgi:hypothetical protein